MRVWHSWLSIGLTVAALQAVDHFYFQPRHDQKLAQAAYDYGRYVGRVVGQCGAIEDIAKSNPDSEWAQSATVKDAIAACRKADEQHAPGTSETVSVK